MDVIGVGDADIDIYLSIEHIPTNDEKIRASNYAFHPGGMVVNTLVALSRLGRSCGYHGRIGDDAFGSMVSANLRKNRVDTRGLIVRKGSQTFFCVILLDGSGEKALITAPTGCEQSDPDEISENLISQAVHLHTTAFYLPTALRAITLAKTYGLSVSLDVDAGNSVNNEDLINILSQIDIIFLNRRGAAKFGNTSKADDAAHRIAALGAKMVCVTLGEEGSIVATVNKTIHTPAIPVEAVDTTGAGDCFAAGFIHGYLANWPLSYTCGFANAVAAINITQVGGHAGAPKLEAVKKFMNEGNI